VDVDGQPVEGARVWGGPRATTIPWMLDSAAAARAPVASGRTSATGDFSVPGIASGDVRVLIRMPGHAPLQLDELWRGAGSELDVGEQVLRPGGELSGRIVDAGGVGIEGARIYARDGVLPRDAGERGGFGASPVGVSGAGGAFRLDQLAGEGWSFAVHADGHVEQVFSGVLSRDLFSDPVEWRLAAAVEIRGTLVGAGSDGLDDLVVHALPSLSMAADEESRTALPLAPEHRPGYRRVAVAQDGSFVLTGLAAGEPYHLRALPAGVALSEQDAFAGWTQARGGDVGVELRTPDGASLEFSVVDSSNGLPVEAFTVHLQGALPADLADSAGEPIDRHPGGLVRIEPVRPLALRESFLFEDLPEGEDFTLEIRAPFHTARSVPVRGMTPGQRIGLGRIQLVPLPVLEVHARDAENDAAVEGARVRLLPLTREATAASDADGIARLGWVPTDQAWSLLVSCPGYGPWVGRFQGPPASDGAPIEALLLAAGRIHVTVVDPSGGEVRAARVLRRSPDALLDELAPIEPVLVDADGTAVLHDLAPGVHFLRAESAARLFQSGPLDGLSWAEVLVQADGESRATLIADRLESLSGAVLAGRLALEGCELRLARGPWIHREFVNLADPDATRTARADAGGGFAFDGLLPGIYNLSIDHELTGVHTGRTLRVAPGQGHTVIDVGDTALAGTVLDSDGFPARDVSVLAFGRRPDGPADDLFFPAGSPLPLPDLGLAPIAAGLSDASGRWRLTAIPPDVLLQLVFQKGPLSAVLPAPRLTQGQTREGVLAQLEQEASLTLAIGASGARRLAVLGRRIDRAALPGISLVVDEAPARGDYVLPPGRWLLRLYELDRWDRLARIGPAKTVKLPAGGSSQVRLDMP
jgi:hypothetical protein